MWEPKTLTLVWPIESDKQEQITILTFKLITHAEHTKALKEHSDNERVIFEKFAFLSCGLSADEFIRLKKPDQNSLIFILSDYVSSSTADIYKQKNIDFPLNNPPLLVPIIGDNGQMINDIKMKVPTVRVTDIMDTLPEDKRNDFITQDITGLSQSEMDRLATQDWNYTQQRIADFLGQTGEYFQNEMSN